ncbi:MAG TPA: hypothetical protein VJA47_00560, partial [archaeon]|nr:hypothetical protein [archaeon]
PYLERENFSYWAIRISGTLVDRSDGSVAGRFEELSNGEWYLLPFSKTRLQKLVEEYVASRASAVDSSTSEQPNKPRH